MPSENLTALQCDDSNPSNDKFCSWETTGISEYYRWETGENDWNRASFLVRDDNGSAVNFTAPQEISYTVPSNTSGNRPYGELAGATLRLEFQGAGNIGGIPGKCFSIDNNSEVSCDSNSRYVPAFSIPDNASLTVGGATKWVRAMEKKFASCVLIMFPLIIKVLLIVIMIVYQMPWILEEMPTIHPIAVVLNMLGRIQIVLMQHQL